MATPPAAETLRHNARQVRAMAAKSPFKADRARFTALADAYDRRADAAESTQAG